MQLPRNVSLRVVVIALSICLAGVGCGNSFDPDFDPDGLARGSIVLIGSFLPTDTCAVWLMSWLNDERKILDERTQYCRELGANREGASVGSGVRTVGGAGAFVVDTVRISGTVAGSKLPRWTAILSSTPGAAPGVGISSAAVGLAATDDDGDPAGAVPAKILATLYDVDQKGKRKKIGKKQARFDKKTAGASVQFDNLSGARDHYEIDVAVKGGKVTGGTVSYAASTATDSSARVGSISRRWGAEDALRSGATPATTWAGVGITSSGKTVARKVPQATIVAYLEQSSRVAGRSAAFDVIGLAMQADGDLNPAKQQLKKVKFTLYAVDAKGKRKMLATRTGNVAKKSGMAIVAIEGVAAPASHYEIDATVIGGKMQDSNLSLSAIVAPAGLAGRVLRSGSVAGARPVPPQVETSRVPSESASRR